jgi:hypothetical protein
MAIIPQQVLQAWERKEPKLVFTTTDQNGNPNAVWVSCVKIMDGHHILIVNNFFHKTLQNVLAHSTGSLLFIAPEREAYQLKGNLSYHTDDKIYHDMKSWLDPKFAGVGAVVMDVTEIYYGAEKLV